jgi:hypothetical protein
MRRLIVIVGILASPFISSHRVSAAPADVFQLLTGFSAKETCSCVFVVGQTDAYCMAFGQQSGYSVGIQIDHTAQTVTTSFLLATRVARAGATGCKLDPP